LERSVGFYRDVIGLPFRFASESYAEFETEGAKFALYARSHLPELIGRTAPPGEAPWPQGEVAFMVDDVDAEHERLRAAGVSILAQPSDRPWGERTLHVTDPDGNVVELTRPKER
jgi:lactoylglutathione lyase